MKSLFITTVIGIASLATLTQANATFLPNDGFEYCHPGSYPLAFTIPIDADGHVWTVVGPQYSPITHLSPAVQVASKALWGTDSTGHPYTGEFLDLTDVTGAGGIQTTFSTVVGQTYRVSFEGYNYSSTVGNILSVQASLNAVRSFTDKDLPGRQATTLTYEFTAASANTSLTFMDLTEYDSNASWIDNIATTPVPEPSTYFAGISVSLMLATSFLRRRK